MPLLVNRSICGSADFASWMDFSATVAVGVMLSRTLFRLMPVDHVAVEVKCHEPRIILVPGEIIAYLNLPTVQMFHEVRIMS